MKFITGCALLFNMEALNKTGYFDENIFLYYEEHDLYHRSLKLGLNIYLIDEAKYTHGGTSSTDPNYMHEIYLNRNWHYCWSKFYFYKKHYNYLYAFIKTFPNLVRAFKYYIYFKFKKDEYNIRLHKAELSGLFSAYMLKKSYYRPNIN